MIYDFVITWGLFAQELIEAQTLELKLLVNQYLAERLFPRIAG